MKRKSAKLTTSQFAKLHEVNKRTLHYYDCIGIFSPVEKGENGYRYYDSSQSLDFEFLLMLKELNMSIEEIHEYISAPTPAAFQSIAGKKALEIDQQIKKLQHTKQLLHSKQVQLELCNKVKDSHIEILNCDAEKFLTAPLNPIKDNFQELFSYVKQLWGIEQCRAGIGSYISMDKIKANEFDSYDGLFTPSLNSQRNTHTLTIPKGKYLCGYFKGTWDDLPKIYTKMMIYAKQHQLELVGYAYERGMNDFAIDCEENYITQIKIKIKD